ncbi:MAG TPA: hypothetical protein VGB78_04265 [Thermoplasmata archaeon]|jgi:hypothetical protein
MRKTYVRVVLSSDGESPKQVIERMMRIGATPVVGDYDFELSVGEEERLFDKLEEVHSALKGSGAWYSLSSRMDFHESSVDNERKPAVQYLGQTPIETKKQLYKAKLDRWKEMGLDVSELERLLDQDIDKFKAASKKFLRANLVQIAEVKDKRHPENLTDGEILALLDENGRTIQQIVASTGYFEDKVTLSLGRLISAGSVRMETRGSKEFYCLMPPPAPPIRKTRVVRNPER